MKTQAIVDIDIYINSVLKGFAQIPLSYSDNATSTELLNRVIDMVKGEFGEENLYRITKIIKL